MAYIDVNEKDFQKEVLESDVPVLVDFWAPWCGPCRQMGPIVEKLGDQYAGKAKIAKINVDKNGSIAARYGIRGIPAIKVFQNGQEVDGMVGLPGDAENKLRRMLDPLV